MKLPRMSLHIGDYLKDTSHLDAAQSGAYLGLIMHYWATGGLPNDDKQLARIAKMTARQWTKNRSVIAAFFDHQWKHKRIDAEMQQAVEKYEKRASAGRIGGLQKASNARLPLAAKPKQPLTLTPIRKEEEKKGSRSVANATRPADSPFDRFKQAYPKRDGPNPWKPAEDKFAAIVRSGTDPEEIIGGAERCAADARVRNIYGTSYVPQAKTWLHQQRWRDYPVGCELIPQNNFGNNGKVLNGSRNDADRTLSAGIGELRRELFAEISHVPDVGFRSGGAVISLVPQCKS